MSLATYPEQESTQATLTEILFSNSNRSKIFIKWKNTDFIMVSWLPLSKQPSHKITRLPLLIRQTLRNELCSLCKFESYSNNFCAEDRMRLSLSTSLKNVKHLH